MKTLPKIFLKSTVAIGFFDNKKEFKTSATGFLVGKRIFSDKLVLFLVTNRHVVDNKKEIVVRFGSFVKAISLDKNWNKKIFEEVDLAIIHIGKEILGKIDPKRLKDVKYFTDSNFITSSEMLKKSVGPGHQVFVPGFPLGISGRIKNFPILRSGIIARLDEEVLIEDKVYLIDCAIHEGNSGGFVILKSTKVDLPIKVELNQQGTVENFCVAGVVFAITEKIKSFGVFENGRWQPRMILEESVDLGRVIPMEYVKEGIDFLYKKFTEKLKIKEEN